MKSKGVVDGLFILRATVNHAKYLNKELLTTFYDIEKCFDSLWLKDCINSLWDLEVKDDTRFLIYLMNTKASVTIKTLMGDTCPLILLNLVKQETVLGPLLNNCSLVITLDLLGYKQWSLLTILQTQAAAGRLLC